MIHINFIHLKSIVIPLINSFVVIIPWVLLLFKLCICVLHVSISFDNFIVINSITPMTNFNYIIFIYVSYIISIIILIIQYSIFNILYSYRNNTDNEHHNNVSIGVPNAFSWILKLFPFISIFLIHYLILWSHYPITITSKIVFVSISIFHILIR